MKQIKLNKRSLYTTPSDKYLGVENDENLDVYHQKICQSRNTKIYLLCKFDSHLKYANLI